jgi:hypothetical protein
MSAPFLDRPPASPAGRHVSSVAVIDRRDRAKPGAGCQPPLLAGVDFELKSWRRNAFRTSYFKIWVHISRTAPGLAHSPGRGDEVEREGQRISVFRS